MAGWAPSTVSSTVTSRVFALLRVAAVFADNGTREQIQLPSSVGSVNRSGLCQARSCQVSRIGRAAASESGVRCVGVRGGGLPRRTRSLHLPCPHGRQSSAGRF